MRRLALPVLLLLACGGDEDGDGGDGARPDAAAEDDPDANDDEDLTCGPARQHARITVTGSDAYGNVYAAWDDLPFPAPDLPELEVDGCIFVGNPTYFCDPVCQGNTLCGTGDVCRPLPTSIQVGTLHVAGTDPELDLEPQPGDTYYTTENYPGLLQPGDLVTVSGGGVEGVPAFEISARGVPDLSMSWESLTAVEHAEMVVTWDVAEDSPEGAQIVLHMDSDHHGARAYVECWSDDTGQLTVPAAVIDPLILAGESGIGTYIENAWLARRHRATIDTDDGCAVLHTEYSTNIPVETVRDE